MKKILQYILLTIFLSYALLACEKNYDVGNPETKLALNSFVTSNTLWRLQLNSTKNPYDDSDIIDIQDASINIFLSKKQVGTFSYTGNGVYVTDYMPSTNEVLRIEVKKDGYKDISTSSYVPAKVQLLGFSKELIVNYENEVNMKYSFSASSLCDYLIIRHIVYKKSLSLNNDTIPFTDTVLVQGIGDIYERVLPSYANTKSIFAKKESYTQEISFQSYDGFIKNENLISGISKIEVFTCSQDYYEYQKSLENYKWNNQEVNTSIVNPSELYSNIENGLGIFAGFTKQILIDTFK